MGKMEGERRNGRQRMRGLDGVTDSMDVSLSKLRAMEKEREAWSAAMHAQSVMADSATAWIVAARFLCLWDFPGKNPGVGFHFLLQGFFLTQG